MGHGPIQELSLNFMERIYSYISILALTTLFFQNNKWFAIENSEIQNLFLELFFCSSSLKPNEIKLL